MAIHMPLVDPKKIQCPLCLIRAEHDGNATEAELFDFSPNCRTRTNNSFS